MMGWGFDIMRYRFRGLTTTVSRIRDDGRMCGAPYMLSEVIDMEDGFDRAGGAMMSLTGYRLQFGVVDGMILKQPGYLA